MGHLTPGVIGQAVGAMPATPPLESGAARLWRSFPAVPAAIALVMPAFLLLPLVNSNTHLIWTMCGVGGFLLAWSLIVWGVALRRNQTLTMEWAAYSSHYVQGCVQLCLLAYWGWFAREVYAQAPLILAQLLFLYAFEALITWGRGRTWRAGFGPLPIIFSTNLLLWFKHDWFIFQFVMVALGALGKQFITWERDGRRVHIFNPSAFGQSLVAVVLITMGLTDDLTWGRQIASTFEAPHMLILIFVLGLLVQHLFHVTLMTVAAVATLCVLNLVYTAWTGTYLFVNASIAAPIFLGMHLLMTDPSTSPRTNVGRVIFGSLYAVGYTVLFRVFDLMEVPIFWDKLLPVPILNLCVPLFDWIARGGLIGLLNRWWEAALPKAQLNFVHQAAWVALFGGMYLTGFIEAPHPGNSVQFWKQAHADGKAHAGHSLVMVAGAHAVGGGSGAAYNELGLICMEGKIARQSNAKAAQYFGEAVMRGDPHGARNLVVQFLFLGEMLPGSEPTIAAALDLLEQACGTAERDRIACFLVGAAYEKGRGRPRDIVRAMQFYHRSGNLYACKGLVRLGLTNPGLPYDLWPVLPALEEAAGRNDAEAHWYLAYMYELGRGVPQDASRARSHLQAACQLGLTDACAALQSAALPSFRNPKMSVPGWSTAYPTP